MRGVEVVLLNKILISISIALVTAPIIAQDVAIKAKHEFGVLQCRADAQKWTYDSFDKKLPDKKRDGTAIMVNGQFRALPHLSYGVAASELLIRAHEMDICIHEDADFEKQFATYSSISSSYSEERTFRYKYFLAKHNLDDQFRKEDAEEFK
jgi:hypothetical protein